MLDPDRLAVDLLSTLHTSALGRPAHVYSTIGSTQDDARRLARAGAPHGTLSWAVTQTAGRGRLSRRWWSPPGAGLWFSIVLRPPLAPAEAPFLAIVAGVGVAEALAQVRPDVRLKWPNDLVLDGAKLGGILAEADGAGGRLRSVVLGCGINLRLPAGDADPTILSPPAGLVPEGAPLPSLPATLALVLGGIEDAYEHYLAAGPAPIQAAWRDRSATLGRNVRADLGAGDSVSGRAVDLDPDGSLVLEVDGGGRLRVGSGEVVHLR